MLQPMLAWACVLVAPGGLQSPQRMFIPRPWQGSSGNVGGPWDALRPPVRRVSPLVLCDPAADANSPQPQPTPTTSAAAEAETEKSTYSDNWSGAGRFSDEEPLPLSFWLLGPKPRRGILTSLGIWGLIAPATNLWGTGSFLLSLAPQTARDAKLDTFYPISRRRLYPYSAGYLSYDSAGAFKRYVDDAQRFEFMFPATYVQDQAVFMKNQYAAYSRRMMDPTLAGTPSRNGVPSRRSQQGVAVAVGPSGGTGEENLSVVIGRLPPGFTLRGTFGSPEEGAQRLLEATINRQSVVAKTTLLAATERLSARSQLPLFQFEYRVDYTSESQPPSYTICVVGSARDELFTFASRVPAAVWDERAADLREAAESFVLVG